jgi:hypothetical protein
MKAAPPELSVVPLAEHIEAERKTDRSEIVKVLRIALERAERGEFVGVVIAYQWAPEHTEHGGGIGAMRGVATGGNAATLLGAVEMAKIDIWDRYLRG